MSDFDLLTEPERKLLGELGRNSTQTPQQLASQLGWTWQAVVQRSKFLETGRYIRVIRLGKQTTYELAPDGEKILAEAGELEQR